MFRYNFLSFVLLALMLASCQGFMSPCLRNVSELQKTRTSPMMAAELLIMKPSTQSTDTSRTSSLQSQGDENNDGKKSNVGADIIEAISLLWSYSIQFLGVALTIGLVLNLCGYAYSFDFSNMDWKLIHLTTEGNRYNFRERLQGLLQRPRIL